MASDLLSRLDAMGRAEHDDLSVAAEAAEEIRRLAAERAAAWRAGMEEAAKIVDARATRFNTRAGDASDTLEAMKLSWLADGALACAAAIRARIKEKAGE